MAPAAVLHGLPTDEACYACSEHVKELNNVRPKQPFYFLKPPSSIVLPGAGPVIQPKGIDLHYEVELGLIMGKRLRDLPESDEKGALDAIECE